MKNLAVKIFKARDLTKKIVHDVFKNVVSACMIKRLWKCSMLKCLSVELIDFGIRPKFVSIETLKNFPDSFNPDRKLLEGDILFLMWGQFSMITKEITGETFCFWQI